jgi:ferritin-like protein
MGTLGRKIVDTNVEELVQQLNKAYSDEWLAYYQYWIGSKIVRGPNKEAVIAEPCTQQKNSGMQPCSQQGSSSLAGRR